MQVMLFFDAMQEKYATNTQGMQAIQQLDAGIEMVPIVLCLLYCSVVICIGLTRGCVFV